MAQIVDLVVSYRGAAFAQKIVDEDTILPRALLNRYTAQNAASAGRELVRIGEFTDSIGNSALIEGTLNEMRFHLRNKTLGTICIYGSSSGGRNALDLAVRLSQNNIFTSMQYVGLLDAAFSPADTLDIPNADATNVPMMNKEVKVVFAFKRENFFQIAGNHRESRFPRPGLFQSEMGGKEIHGDVPFFNRRNLTDQIKSLPNTTKKSKDDGHHGNLIVKAFPIAQVEIAGILDDLIPKGPSLNFVVPPLDPLEETVHVVVSGDNLSKLAKRFYGNEALWPKIYAANRSVIGANPNLIRVGQRLVIPK
jgi:LysM repeat protein